MDQLKKREMRTKFGTTVDDHFTGKYRGAAHSKCNMLAIIPNFILVVFHNLEGYDSHLFIPKLALDGEVVNCIPKTEEKYISFSKEIGAIGKIGTLGVHVSAQRNSMVTMKKISLTIISKHLYFEVTIQLFSRLLAI